MPTIVEQIQRDALDPNVPVSTLLRRVKLAAVKLGLGTVEDWVEQELNGYSDSLPDYRLVTGQPTAFIPYHGWLPVGGDPETIEILSRRGVGQSIASLENKAADPQSRSLHITYPASIATQLHEGDGSFPTSDLNLIGVLSLRSSTKFGTSFSIGLSSSNRQKSWERSFRSPLKSGTEHRQDQ